MKIEEAMEDISGRFFASLPQEELLSSERLLFRVEEAHWFYEDYYRKKHNLSYLSLKDFFKKILDYTDVFLGFSDLNEEFKRFLKYKKSVPVFGALLFNGSMSKVVLVQGYGPARTYTFPRGKICKAESEISCAIREVYEEVGYDITNKVISSLSIEMPTKNRISKLFIILNVPETTHFKTHTHNEIKDIKWIDISYLESTKEEMMLYVKSYIKEIKSVVKKVKELKVLLDRKRIEQVFGEKFKKQ
ncbi:mRNA-decapping enzyme subunit 2 [Nematocida sp. LUAm1]|nr:mRNA-decapping enzyme subunit 2 [Nematocida sp. LUAm2]KAI5178192.1 mRNA-decapping enzyme subunit 2 [Nematocida sp. LUAm1]